MPSFSAPSNTVLSGGGFVRPSWRRGQSAETWLAIPASNTMDDIDPDRDPALNPNYPSNAPWHGVIGLQGATTAWCGMCFDQRKSTLWSVLNGGHADYGGNETYRYRMDVDVPAWEMILAPSGGIGNQIELDDGQEATGLFADGRPRNTHTYNKPVYIPGLGPGLGCQGSVWKSAQDGTSNAIVISEVTGEMLIFGPANNGKAASTYDPSRHCVWTRDRGTAVIKKLDLATRTVSSLGSLWATSGGCALIYIPGHDFLFYAGSTPTNNFALIDPEDGSRVEPALSGSFANMTLGYTSPPAYVPAEDAVYFWDNTENTQTLNRMAIPADPWADTWVVEQVTYGGATPTVRNAWGTYGRFGYSERLDGFFVFNAIDDPVYFGARS